MPKQDSTKALLKSSDVQKVDAETSSPQEATVNPFLVSEDPVNIQMISIQAAVQKITNASLGVSGALVQVLSDRSRLIQIPLSLSLDSVDIYYSCSHKMLIKVKRHYLPRSTREGLHSTYTKRCALKATKTKDIYDSLSWNHFRALCLHSECI